MRPLKALICLVTFAMAFRAYALQGDAPQDGSFQIPLTSMVTPLFLEKSINPYALTPETGWQVGGLNTNFSNSRNGSSLTLHGGLFYSQGLAPRSLLDSNVPLPDSILGDAPAIRATGLPSALGFDGQARENTASDRITYQKVDYTAGGLNLSGSYADVGADFQGLDALTKQMNASDPAGAKLLKLGMRHTDYAATYSGIKGMNFSTKTIVDENTKQGHAENGLTRSTTTHGAGLALGQRNRVEYSIQTVSDEWDQTVVKRDTREVRTETLKLSGDIGQKSKFSLGQTEVRNTTGQQQADTRQHDLALQWNDWKNVAFSANYTSKLTEQTGVEDDQMKLGMSMSLSPTTKLTGALESSANWNPKSAKLIEKEFRDVKLESRLLPSLNLVSQQTVDARDANKGETTTLSQKIAWNIAPTWQFKAELVNGDNEKTDDVARREYLLTHRHGAKDRPEEINIFSREEELPNQVTQERREITYTGALNDGKKPATLLLRAGAYDWEAGEIAADDHLMTAQLLNLQPGNRTTLSVGFYNGPTLGADALRYRAWGAKPKGNLGVWTMQDFTPYREWGGELVHQLSDTTKVVVKQYAGEFEGCGEQTTMEYGIEQRVGIFTMQTGRRMTELLGKPEGEESWWRLDAASGTKLPDWTTNAVRANVFQDSAAWGIGQAPVWIAKPIAGFTIDRRQVLVANTMVDDYSCRVSHLLDDNLFLQASFERNPRKDGNANQVDAVHRGMAQLTYRIRPDVHIFSRLIGEERQDKAVEQQTMSYGFIGKFSPEERLQVQIDLLKNITDATALSGNAYAVEYERTLSADNTLMLKARLNPDEFSKPEERVKLEVSYKRVF